MQIENFDFKIGEIEAIENRTEKSIVRLKEYREPFLFYGKTKDYFRSKMKGEVICVIRKRESRYNWILLPSKPLGVYTPDGSSKKDIYFIKVQEKYNNGFFADIRYSRVFIKTQVRVGDYAVVVSDGVIKEKNGILFIEPENVYDEKIVK